MTYLLWKAKRRCSKMLHREDHLRRGLRGTWKKTASWCNPVITSDLERDLAGVRMGRAAGARVWEGGADGGADDWYHHCLGP